MKFKIILLFTPFFLNAQLPNNFVYVDSKIPTIAKELRYYSKNNFVGKQIEGYNKNVVILTVEATEALKKVQEELLQKNLSLKIFDAYRPQKAVNHFKKWAKVLEDTLMKQQYYPNEEKINLFKHGYIASFSRHSSGSTLDVTIIDLITKKELDMGTSYDFLDKKSWTNSNKINRVQHSNRMLLKNVMTKYGFRNYYKEWWHFTLNNEPFRNKYFDFFVQ